MAAPDNSITLLIGSDTVTGTLTQFVADDGDLLVVSGKPVGIVKQRLSNTQLKLYWPWDGPAITDEVKWKVLPYGANWHSVVVFNTRLAQLLDKYEAGIGVQVNASGTLAARAAYDDAAPPFMYLQNDVTPYVLFSKKSATHADWSAGSPLGGTASGGGGTTPPPTPVAPQNTSAPVISGMNPAVGDVLSVTVGSWSGYPAPTFAYQWRANGTAIAGATANSYTVAAGDVGKRLSVTVTASNSQGSNSATSAATTAVIGATGTDTTPNPFTFVNVTNASLATVYISNEIRVDGVNAPTPISITGTGATYSINGGTYSAAAGTVNQDDRVTVKVTSSSSNNAVVAATLTIGGVSATYSVTTIVSGTADSTPDAFDFGPAVTGAALNSVVTSPPVLIQGINVAAPVTVTGGQWSKNNGPFSVSSGTVVNGDSVQVQATSAAQAGATVTVTLTVGGVSDTFSVTTAVATGTALGALTLNNITIAENATPGTPIGTIQGQTPGSTITLSNNAGGRVSLSGGKIVAGSTAIDYEAETQFDISLTETLAGASGSPKVSTITIFVVNVNETVTSSATTYPTLTNGMVGPTTPPGGYIKRSADMDVYTAGTVIENLDMYGRILVHANNVTIRNCKLSADWISVIQVDRGVTGCLIQRCDIDGMYTTLNGVAGCFTIENSIIRRCENAVNIEGYVPFMIRQCYIYDFKKDPADAGHRDAIQVFGDREGPMTGQIIGNTVIMDGNPHGNCALYSANTFGKLKDVFWRNNWASDPGGGYTCSFQGDNGGTSDTMVNVRYEDNYLVRGYAGYLRNVPGVQGTPVIYQNNIEVLPGSALAPENAPWIVNGVPQAQGGTGGTATLQDLAITNGTVVSGAPAGTVVGTLRLTTQGATYTLVDDAGGRFALDGRQVVTTATPTNFATAQTHSIVVRETMAGAVGSPKTSTITIAVTQGAGGTVSLQALDLSNKTIVSGSAANTVVGTVVGKTPNSTLSLSDSASGRFKLNGTNIELATTTGSAGATYNITLSETLAGASNSPRSTTLTITVAAAAPVLANLTLSNTTVPEDLAQGAVVGTIQGKTTGSTITLSNNANNCFGLSGNNVIRGTTPLDYETTGPSHQYTIQLQEGLTGAQNSPRTSTITITVTDVPEATTETIFAHASPPSGSALYTDNNPGGFLAALRFTAVAAGTIKGVWFYRPSASMSADVTVGLWTAPGGPLLYQADAITSVVGWHFVPFDPGVPVSAGHDLIIAYMQASDASGNVYYRHSPSTLSSPVTSSTGKMTATLGLYRYGPGFIVPSQGAPANGTFWVDVEWGP